MNELHVFTDGSCINQADVTSRSAGIGVAFGPKHASNLSEPLPGELQHSARAELYAVLRALQLAKQMEKEAVRPLVIHCDSTYAVLEMNRILHPNKHKKIAGERKNGDLISQMSRTVLLFKGTIRVVHIRREQNKVADELARTAAQKAYEQMKRRTNKNDN